MTSTTFHFFRMIGIHVDDLLVTGGGLDFERTLKALTERLPFGAGQEGKVTFCGEVYEAITVDGEHQVLVTQVEHIQRITEIPTAGLRLSPGAALTPSSISDMKSRNEAIQYVASHVHQHLAVEVGRIAGRTKPGAVKQDLLDCNKLVRRARSHQNHACRFRWLARRWSELRMVLFSDAGWATRPLGRSQCGGLHFMTADAALRGDSAPCRLIDTQCQKITWKTGNAHEAETHAAIMNLRTVELHQFTFWEMCNFTRMTVSEFLRVPVADRIFLAIVVDDRGLFTQVDVQKLEKRSGIYVHQLLELVERLGRTFTG